MILINLIGFALIAFIVWWFWLYQEKATQIDGASQTINVNSGIYSPSKLTLKANQQTELSFLREDESACSQTLQIPDLGINAELVLGKVTKVSLPPLAKGEYAFHCQMKMYRGLILVE